MIEEYLKTGKSRIIPYDYKFYMFGKKCAFITIIERNSNVSAEEQILDVLPEWIPCEFRIINTQTQSVLPDKPIAGMSYVKQTKLGKELEFMRIDSC